LGSYPYKNVDKMTMDAPRVNAIEGSKSSRNHQETKLLNKIDKETANPLRILSAYLTTKAMTNPP